MVIDFELELAKLAIKAGTGRIVTAGGEDVEITDWGDNPCPNGDKTFPVRGKIIGSLIFDDDVWTREGKFLSGRSSDLDLAIKVDDELWL